MSFVLAALPDCLAVRFGGPEVVDDYAVRSSLDLDPLLSRLPARRCHRRSPPASRRRTAAIPRRRPRAALAGPPPPGRPVTSSIGAPISGLRRVHEVAHLTDQPSPLPPVVIPVPVRYLSRLPPGTPRVSAAATPASARWAASTAGDQRRLKPIASWRPDSRQAASTSSSFHGQRERLLAPDMAPGGQRPHRQIRMGVVRSRDHDHLDVRIGR